MFLNSCCAGRFFNKTGNVFAAGTLKVLDLHGNFVPRTSSLQNLWINHVNRIVRVFIKFRVNAGICQIVIFLGAQLLLELHTDTCMYKKIYLGLHCTLLCGKGC